MSNGLTFPYTNQSTASHVRHYQKLRVVPSQGGAVYSNIQMTYVNFAAINGGESADFQPVTVQAEILYQGVYYPVMFNGQQSATMTAGGSVTGSVASLSLPSGAQFFERVRLVGSRTGAQKYLVSHGARRALLEGALATTNTSVNLLGGKEGHGATCAFVLQSGKITSATIKTAGSNYTSGGTVAAFDPTTQAETTVGYSNQSGGKMSSIVINNAGAGFTSQTKCVITGGGGFGQNAAVYGAAMITGVPNVQGLKSFLIVGDSIARGYGSTDSQGDASANYGIFERAVGNRYATTLTALPGNTATAYRNLKAHARMYAIVLPYVTHAMVNLGTNDITMGYSASTVANANTSTAAELRQAGIKVSFATLIPRADGSFATLAGQRPVSGFAAGQAADTYNTWVRNGTNGVGSDWGIIDARAVYQDATQKTKWRVDSVMTNDGIHPNVAKGIPFGAAQLADRFGPAGSAPASTIPEPETPPADSGTGGSGTVGSGGSETPSGGASIVSYASNVTINAASNITSIVVHGTGDTINGNSAAYTLSALAGGNTVNAGFRQATLNIGGASNTINIGAANTWINDNGTYNIIKLAEAAKGVAVITGSIFGKGTRLDLRTLLASTAWDGNAGTLGQFLRIYMEGSTAILIVTPTGNSAGTKYTAAKFTSYPSLTLSTLLAYSIY